MAGRFLSDLVTKTLDSGLFELVESFDYRLGIPPSGIERVCVPTGFVTDFTSVPIGLRNIVPTTGRHGKAAVVHDFLYRCRQVTVMDLDGSTSRLVTRKEADEIMLEAMTVLGVRWSLRQTIYLGLRAGGWVTWNRYRRGE